jgi:hypothetical protein
MDGAEIISAIDAEIAALQKARALLTNSERPAGVTGRKATVKAAPRQPKRRILSPEARKRIGDAQRKRWAAARKPKKATPAKATKKAAKKTTPVKAKKAVSKKAAKAAPAGAKPEAQKAEAPF